MMAKKIEVFQDLALQGPVAKRRALHDALIAAAIGPWQADLQRSEEIARNAVTSGDVIVFRREASESYPAAGLTLWEDENGYYVSNIVPAEIGSLTYSQYNAVLTDFTDRVVAPVVDKLGFTITRTEPRQSVDDWLSPDAALKLRQFSGAANKSTGSSHPLDERRWFAFIVAAHRAGGKLDASTLARWLHEVEGWDEDSAHRLAGDFENSLSLLRFYDEN